MSRAAQHPVADFPACPSSAGNEVRRRPLSPGPFQQTEVECPDHRVRTVADVEFGEDPQQMRLHRRLRDDQPTADLHVGQSVRHSAQHIHLPSRQRHRRGPSHPGHQPCRDAGSQHGLAPGRGVDGVHQLLARGVLEQVADGARLDGPLDLRVGLVRGQDQHAGPGGPGDDLRGGTRPVEDGHPQIHQHHVGLQPFDETDCRPAVLGLADDLDGGFVRQQGDDPGAHHGVVVRHEDPELLVGCPPVRHLSPARRWESWPGHVCRRRPNW